MQKLISSSTQAHESKERLLLVNSIKGKILEICLNKYGVHVIIKLILSFTNEESQPIIDEILESFLRLAFNKNGIRIIVELIKSSKSSINLAPIGNIILKNSNQLINNEFGNHAVQAAIKVC